MGGAVERAAREGDPGWCGRTCAICGHSSRSLGHFPTLGAARVPSADLEPYVAQDPRSPRRAGRVRGYDPEANLGTETPASEISCGSGAGELDPETGRSQTGRTDQGGAANGDG